MISEIAKNSLRFLILVLLQTLIIKNIGLGTYFVPLPYIMFLLMLPFETMPLLVLVLSFVIGITVDAFYDSQGIHASACVVLGFARFYSLKLLSPREGYEITMKPTVQMMGNAWFSYYAIPLILIHHIFFFFLEEFDFEETGFTLLKAFGSTFVTFVFVYIFQFLFYRKDGIAA